MVNVVCFRIGGERGDGSGGGEAADAAGIYLEVTEAGEIEHVLGLVEVMAAFAAGQFYLTGAGGEFFVGAKGAGHEWLFKPKYVAVLEGR